MHVGEAFAVDKQIPFLQEDLIGHASSYYSNRTPVRVFGRNPNVDNIRLDLWEGPTATYIPPPSAMQMEVVSDNANDTAAGTGARHIYIHYLDANGVEQSEDVTLNGITPVLTVSTNIWRINGSHLVAVGSGETSAGNISIRAVGGAVTYDYISAGRNSSRTGFYTVPANKNFYISHWQSSSGSVGGNHFTQMTLRAASHLGFALPGVFTAVDEVGTQDGGLEVDFPIPIRVPPLTDIKISVVSDGSTSNVIALGAFMGWIE